MESPSEKRQAITSQQPVKGNLIHLFDGAGEVGMNDDPLKVAGDEQRCSCSGSETSGSRDPDLLADYPIS